MNVIICFLSFSSNVGNSDDVDDIDDELLVTDDFILKLLFDVLFGISYKYNKQSYRNAFLKDMQEKF